MRWILACMMALALGCGGDTEGPEFTFITISPVEPPNIPDPEVSCADDPPPSGDEVSFGNPCEFLDSGACELFLDLPPGSCTIRIRVIDAVRGETICVQEEEFVVLEVGDTEVDITLDNCTPVTMPF
ncbi:MAG: hypothetical protein WBG86_21420 [Polyangiales bacterium]